MKDYGGKLGVQYNPTLVAQQGLAYYALWLRTKWPYYQKMLLVQSDWLVKDETADGRFLYRFPWGDQPIPWWSGMAEGQAMSLLIRAYALTDDVRYLTAIQRARTTFERTIANHGVQSRIKVGTKTYVFYEMALGTYCPRVLNGLMFGLIGLYEDWVYLHDTKAKADLYNADRGFATLRTLLPYYDAGDWSYYNLVTLKGPNPRAQETYQVAVVVELRYLTAQTGDKVFAKYAGIFADDLHKIGVMI